LEKAILRYGRRSKRASSATDRAADRTPSATEGAVAVRGGVAARGGVAGAVAL